MAIRVERIVGMYKRGMLTESELLQDVAHAIEDGEVAELSALHTALKAEEVPIDGSFYLAWQTQRVISGTTDADAHRLACAIKSEIITRASENWQQNHALTINERLTPLLSSLEAEWWTDELVFSVKEALRSPDRETDEIRSRALPFLGAHLTGDDLIRWAFPNGLDEAVNMPFTACSAIAHQKTLRGQRAALAEILLTDTARISNDNLYLAMTRLSIERLDALATDAATQLSERLADNDPNQAICALVLWLAGHRTLAYDIVNRLQSTEGEELLSGWGSQGRRAVAFLLRAIGRPDRESFRDLATRESEGLLRSFTSLGAVGERAAYLAMSLGMEYEDHAEAFRQAVIAQEFFAQRPWVLHASLPDLDVRLADRLALSPDEHLEVQQFLQGKEIPVLGMYEGRVIFYT